MKVFLTIILVIAGAVALSAQSAKDCKFITNEVDEFTGDEIKILEPMRLGKNKRYTLKGALNKVEGVYGMILSYDGDLGCLTGQSYAMLKFENGEILELKNIADVDCGSDPVFIGLFKGPDIDLFRTSKLVKLRHSLSDTYVDIDIDNPEFLSKSLDCLD